MDRWNAWNVIQHEHTIIIQLTATYAIHNKNYLHRTPRLEAGYLGTNTRARVNDVISKNSSQLMTKQDGTNPESNNRRHVLKITQEFTELQGGNSLLEADNSANVELMMIISTSKEASRSKSNNLPPFERIASPTLSKLLEFCQ